MQRVAFLPWENLTGDASLDWIAEAGPSMAAAQLAGVGSTGPLPATAVRDAYIGKATRAVHAWFDRRGGKLHFEFSIEDLATHRMRETFALEGDVLPVGQSLTRRIEPQARAFPTANPEAFAAWGQRDYSKAVQLDPGFGTAWLAWAQQTIAANRQADALGIVNQALAQSNLASPIDRARLDVLSASLRGDEGARDQALLELVRLLPNDASLARQLADRFHNARRFDSAVRLYREVARLEPDDAPVHNQLGYALFFSGDLAAARAAFDSYAKYPGQEANALDSQGEVLFMAGQFADAERYFAQAHAKSETLLQGGDLLKAAYAKWLAGDQAAADQRFAEYVKYRSAHGDQLVDWRTAVWLFSTGRQREAAAELRSAQGPAARIAAAQIQIWEHPEALPTDVDALRAAVQAAPPALDGFVRTLYVRALVSTGQTEQAKEWAKHYPLPDTGPDTADALQRSFTFPLYLELRRQLGL